MRYFKTIRFGITAIVVLHLLFLTACQNEPDDKTISIAIVPSSKSVELGDSIELTVTAKNTAIVWPDSNAVEGTFTVNGNKAKYAPPSVTGRYRFTVSAEANPSKTVTAWITVVYAAPQITISPQKPPEIKVGQTAMFTAETVLPLGQPQPQDPLWEITGDCGTIDQNGLFSAARAGDCTVRASLRDLNNKKITESVVIKIKEPTLDDILGDMVQVRGGTFTRGCSQAWENDCTDIEKPAHQVTLNDYYIGKYEVTQFVWKQIMGLNINPSSRRGDNLPVENASWDDVQEFIEKLNERTGRNYRLPTEAEWEYAARGGNQSRGYVYSGSNILDDVGWYQDNSDSETRPVGMKKANELGIYDMSGNVDEWVSDRFGDYGSGSLNNPTGPASGSARVVRGGSSVRFEEAARVFSRGGYNPGSSNPRLGFRLAITSTR